jgi:hypothetical protein
MLSELFATLFDREMLLDRGRELGALQRLKEIHPADVLLALVRSAVGDEHPSIATARRQFQDLTGYMPEESSFYERLTPGLANLGWETFLSGLSKANRVQRKQVAKALGVRVRDVRAVDASIVTLPSRAAARFPSTDSRLGGFKITATLSVLEDLLLSAHITDAKQHDRKALGMPSDVRSVLWLKDRGYSDHRLFAHIADGGGYFIIRLKTSSKPTLRAIRSGVAKRHLGKRLTNELPFFGVVDVDAEFNIRGTKTRCFRVVGIPVAENKHGEPAYIWLATNLPASVAAGTVGTFYRLRWSIETLFRALKSVGRFDEVPSGNPAVVHAFIAATLIGLVLSQAICAAMRAHRPKCDPSLLRVFALLLCNLAKLAAAYRTGRFRQVLDEFVAALWREGVNPNPGRPYAREFHLAHRR